VRTQMSVFTPDTFSADPRFAKLRDDDAYRAALEEANVKTTVDLWKVSQRQYQYKLPSENRDRLSDASGVKLKELMNIVWKEPDKPTLTAVPGREDFSTAVNPIHWNGQNSELLSIVAQLRFAKAKGKKQYADALLEANANSVGDLKTLMHDSYVHRLNTGSNRVRLSAKTRTALKGLRKKVLSDPLLYTVGSITTDAAVFMDISSCFGTNSLTLASQKRHNLQSAMEKVAAKWVEPLADKEKYTVSKLNNNMRTVPFYNCDPKKNEECKEEGKLLFEDYDNLVSLIHQALVDVGQCKLDRDTLSKHIVMTALLTLKAGEQQQAYRDYTLQSLFGDRNTTRKLVDGPVPDEPFPWAADIPLASGGLNLNLWHGFNEEHEPTADDFPIENWNIRMHVPEGWLLLRRGDLVHAGGLQNAKGNGALRVHWYIPMKLKDVHENGGQTKKVDRTVQGKEEGGISLAYICKVMNQGLWEEEVLGKGKRKFEKIDN